MPGQEGTPLPPPTGEPLSNMPIDPNAQPYNPNAVAAGISAGAEAVGLPPTLPTAENAAVDTASSQAGLAAVANRVGGPAEAGEPAAPTAPEDTGALITGVSGFAQSPAEVAKGLVEQATPDSRVVPIDDSDRRVPIDDFKGDPRRVLGHPSNPSTVMMQAAAESAGQAADPNEKSS